MIAGMRIVERRADLAAAQLTRAAEAIALGNFFRIIA
jgi:hypothetical protein